jgi:glutaconate CoA-transferase subunit B
VLECVHPGGNAEDLKANTGFDYDAPAKVPATARPTPAELELLRGPVAKVISENYPEFARRLWGGSAVIG